ncbi:efflux RND transporter periplasmic adaptor subunit [Tissierella pigra]|uniref:HlyD family efflux transporter periplasmic adaptor subunit n=1 Tax=Tissierella pigra TaxID=2607614 RepID=A0A6N7XQX3_9FIRM|nr:HlyD family efflux transporter periplasmic adaptor subunit [Tissierella pigra]MBU5426921.1 efflux RND transporter periplasmic adaptor subunit [Tissierella pigra]MSU03232.1 HlyD family efflux transporter periplasmic adaptor subunit [Tissierella pigra]
MNGKKTRKRKIVTSIIVISVLLTSTYLLSKANKSQEDVMPLREYEVFRDDITAGISASGYLYLPSVNHYFDIPVQIEEVYVRKGDTVKAGDKIAKAVGTELENPNLYSKLDGVVLSVPSVEGEMTAGKPIVAQIGDPKKITASIQVSQADISEIEVGQPVQFTLNAYPTQTLQGIVTDVQFAPKNANPVEYTVYASIDTQEDMLLLEGMTFSAQLIQKQVKDVLCLSNKAIQLREGKQIVLLMDEEGNLFEQEIQTGFSDGRYSEILSGLSEGEIVYVEG